MVATLHQVDIALEHFDRIIGMLEGRIVFDLPSTKVTRSRLDNLYKQNEHELGGDYLESSPELGPAMTAPLGTHCR